MSKDRLPRELVRDLLVRLPQCLCPMLQIQGRALSRHSWALSPRTVNEEATAPPLPIVRALFPTVLHRRPDMGCRAAAAPLWLALDTVQSHRGARPQLSFLCQ